MMHRSRGFLLLTIAGCFAGTQTLAGQTRDELKLRYGQPVSEAYNVRKGITVTASFGGDGRVVEFLIAPQITALIKSRGETLTRDSVNEIIDELVPRSLRGKHLSAGFVNATCLPQNDCNGTSDSYEKVSVFYSTAEAGRLHYAVVQMK